MHKEIYNPWDLYTSHKHFETSTALMDATWNHAQNLSWWAAEYLMFSIMEFLVHIGALDTEPRTILVRKLREKFGQHPYRDNWRGC